MCATNPGLAKPFLTCSKARSVNIANVLAKGTLPQDARPAATNTIFCSAIPRETVLSGYCSLKRQDLVDFPKSASITTTLGSSAMFSNAWPYPSLLAPPDDGALMITPPVLVLIRSHWVLYHGRMGYLP